MSESLALSLLYEILVAESKYESRGIEYRSKLKTLYEQLYTEHLALKDMPPKSTKQSTNKLVEMLTDSVSVLDPTELRKTDLELCYGIHQYVFPKIPDFTDLDTKFLGKWHKFYNALQAYLKLPERRSKRNIEKNKSYTMSKRRNVRESDTSSEPEEPPQIEPEPQLITTEDIERPKIKETQEESVIAKAEDPGENYVEVVEPEIHYKLPIAINKDIEITGDSIVFGLMDEEALNEWASTSSFSTYENLYKEMYSYDASLEMFKQKQKERLNDGLDELVKEANMNMTYVTEEPEVESTSDGVKSTNGKNINDEWNMDEDLGPELEPEMEDKMETVDYETTNNFEGANQKIILTTDFYKTTKPLKLPGNYKQDTENFEAESIFGNYYCPVNYEKVPNKKEEVKVEKRKRGRPRKIKRTRTPRTEVTQPENMDGMETLSSMNENFIVDNLNNNDGFNNTNSNNATNNYDTNSSLVKKEFSGNDEEKEELQSSLIRMKTFTVNFMEVDSIYSCDDKGGFEVKCTARIKDPFISGLVKGKVESNIGVYQELQTLLKKLFALKKKITGNCTVCSGWNLLHGIAQSFCEFCEDKMEKADPELLLKIFEIRRYLLSNIYPIVGYKYETLEYLKEGGLHKNWKELTKNQKVSIQSLTQIGASFPKASLHDSRYVPNPLNLPMSMCKTINKFQYPKSNKLITGLTSNGNGEGQKEEFETPSNTPMKENFINTNSNYTGISTNEDNSHKEGNSVNHKWMNTTGKYNFSADSHSQKEKTELKVCNYSLMDIANHRRYSRAKMLNDFFEEIYNKYHLKQTGKRPKELKRNYVKVFRKASLLSTRLETPEEVKSSEEDDEESEDEEGSESEEEGEEESSDSESVVIKQKRKGKTEKEKEKEKDKEVDSEEEERERLRTEKEDYFDENSSYVLSRLPLDTDMIKLSFYHRGVFMSKPVNIKSYVFSHIGKMFGFKDTIIHPESFPLTKMNEEDSNYNANYNNNISNNNNNNNSNISNNNNNNNNYNNSATNNSYFFNNGTDNVEGRLMDDFLMGEPRPCGGTVFPGQKNKETLDRQDEMMKEQRLLQRHYEEKQGLEEVQQGAEVEEDTLTTLNTTTSGASIDLSNVVFNYNWHEILYRLLFKKPHLARMIVSESDNHEIIKKMMDFAQSERVTDDTQKTRRERRHSRTEERGEAGKENKVSPEVLRELHKNNILQNMPKSILTTLNTTGKIKLGFPTSLEMYILSIPDSIMDCSMYGGVGKGFYYSVEAICHNLALLSSTIRIGTVSNKRRKNPKSSQ